MSTTVYSTVSAAVAAWIRSYEAVAVDTNHVSDGPGKYGLFRMPTRSTKGYIGESYEITEYFQFFARQASANEAHRVDSDEWLEAFTYWADDYMATYEYPELTDGRRILGIEVSGTPYVMESDSSDILYQITLAVTYSRDRRL